MRNEVVLSDLSMLAGPSENICPLRRKSVWNSVTYETDSFSGTLLAALWDSRPSDVTVTPGLSGWYRIFVGLHKYNELVNLRLSGDGAATGFGSDRSKRLFYYEFEDVFWKCADMTGQDVVVSKFRGGEPRHAVLAWLRFVPMTDDEVKAFRQDMARADTKRLYATHDMHGLIGLADPIDQRDWRTVVQPYEQSDVEWLSLENMFTFDGEVTTGDRNDFAYISSFYKTIQHNIKEKYTGEMLRDLAEYGHRLGLKMCSSLRMGAWGTEFPLDQTYFINTFAAAHPQFRCIDRDGTEMNALSYCYPEVQEYMISQFQRMAALGFDAVETIYSRGVPYVLFEPPFVERFMGLYGEDPRELPIDEPRVTALRCEIMTEFMRKLRAGINRIVPDRHVGIHARVFFSLYDCNAVALDPETWAREGLITAIISFPQCTRERLPACVFRKDAPGRIDLAEYAELARTQGHSLIFWDQNFRFLEPMPDSYGVPRGPKTPRERIEQFVELESKYGVRFYAEVMPRLMPPAEYRERILELYDYGCERFSLWDTYNRVPNRLQWTMVRRLGHKEELPSYDDGEGTLWSTPPVVSIGNKNTSRYMPDWGG